MDIATYISGISAAVAVVAAGAAFIFQRRADRYARDAATIAKRGDERDARRFESERSAHLELKPDGYTTTAFGRIYYGILRNFGQWRHAMS